MNLLDICELIVDCPHSTAKDEGHGFPLIRTPNIGKGRLILDNVHRVCKEVYDKRNIRAIPQLNDIILAREAPAGNVALITEGQKVCLGQRTVLIRPDINKVNPEYLVYYMLSPKVQHDLQSSANGATVAHINMPKIKNLKIQIPNRRIQDKIANILSRYDSLIENYQKQIKLLEEAAQRLYKEWFVDLRFPGHENTNIVDGVPEGWEKKCLGDIFSFVRGKSYTSKELSDAGTVMVNLKNIQPFGGYKRGTEKYFTGTFKEEQSLQKGDLVMGVTDMTQERRLVGHVALIPNLDQIATFSMDLIKIIPYKIPKIFLYCSMRYGGISDKISPLANGVNVLHLKPETMMDIELIVPNIEIINKFTMYIHKQIEKSLSLQNQIVLLTEARDRLLPKLMSGEIEV